MSILKKTALYNLHIELGAKMIPFANYDMPIQYPSGIIREHLHCRQYAGLFDISHMGQCLITGQSVAEELEKLTPSNIIGLNIGQQRYAVLTNEQGGIIDDVIITRTESGFFIVVNATCKEKDFAHLKQHLPSHCKIKILQDQALFALQGPSAINILAQFSKQTAKLSFMQASSDRIAGIDCFISRCGYTGEDGFEISVANQYVEKLAHCFLDFSEVLPIGLGARDTLRLEAGLSLYGYELSEMISPVEAGLAWTFRKKRFTFLGSKIIQSQLKSGTEKRQVALIFDGKVPVRNNSVLYNAQGNKVGVVTSGSFSPSLKKPIALALINRCYLETVLYARVRNCKIMARVVQRPFVSHRYYKFLKCSS